jgi:hypothetical protein
MTIEQKLDKILGLLEVIVENQQATDEQLEELREAITDRSLPGSGFSTFDAPED